MDKIIYSVIVLCIVGIHYVIYDDIVSEKISLRKDQWTCTLSHTEYILIDKLLTPHTVCDNYRKTNQLER